MLNELTQNFSTKSQPIYFVLAPNMQNSTLNSNLMKINAVIQKFADDNSYETIKSSEVLSPGNKFVKSINNKILRTDDGVHISVNGGKILSDFIFNKISSLINLDNINDDEAIKVIKVPGCCVAPKTKSKTLTTRKPIKFVHHYQLYYRYAYAYAYTYTNTYT